jgi:hypothetical protein
MTSASLWPCVFWNAANGLVAGTFPRISEVSMRSDISRLSAVIEAGVGGGAVATTLPVAANTSGASV